MSELGFFIEKRGSVDVLVWDAGGCRPALGSEKLLFSEIADLKAKLDNANALLKDSTEHLIDNVKRQVKDAARIKELEEKLEAAENDATEAYRLLKEGANHLKESMAREEKNYAWIKEAKAQNAALGRAVEELREAAYKVYHAYSLVYGPTWSGHLKRCIDGLMSSSKSPPSDQSSKMTGVGGLCGINHEWISDSDGAHCLVCGAAYAPPAKERDACMEQEYAREEYLNDDGRSGT